MWIFTNVDRVLPVLQYLCYNKNIDEGSVFPLLVLEGGKRIRLSSLIHKHADSVDT